MERLQHLLLGLGLAICALILIRFTFDFGAGMPPELGVMFAGLVVFGVYGALPSWLHGLLHRRQGGVDPRGQGRQGGSRYWSAMGSSEGHCRSSWATTCFATPGDHGHGHASGAFACP